jgi:3-phenylpropionate/cinnamic acid dioxygenase small subunit
MSTVSQDVLQRIDALQIEYIAALDRKDMPGWLASFDAQGSYICIAAENVEHGLPLALMMDDCHERLEDRVTYVTKVWAGTFEDYQTRHFIQRISCADAGGGLYGVVTNFSVLYTAEQGKTEILVAGRYEDEVILSGGGAKFRSKKAVMDTNISPRYIVYPV